MEDLLAKDDTARMRRDNAHERITRKLVEMGGENASSIDPPTTDVPD